MLINSNPLLRLLQGNVQMCAMLAMLVPKELKLGKAAVKGYIEAYAG